MAIAMQLMLSMILSTRAISICSTSHYVRLTSVKLTKIVPSKAPRVRLRSMDKIWTVASMSPPQIARGLRAIGTRSI